MTLCRYVALKDARKILKYSKLQEKTTKRHSDMTIFHVGYYPT